MCQHDPFLISDDEVLASQEMSPLHRGCKPIKTNIGESYPDNFTGFASNWRTKCQFSVAIKSASNIPSDCECSVGYGRLNKIAVTYLNRFLEGESGASDMSVTIGRCEHYLWRIDQQSF